MNEVNVNQIINLNYNQLVQISCEMSDRMREYNPSISQGEIEYELIRAIRAITEIDFFKVERELSKE